ncbi:MAG: hypothetical protein AAF329_25895, partial [Cyanobacteria bacterium P01_A01_bin.17]
ACCSSFTTEFTRLLQQITAASPAQRVRHYQRLSRFPPEVLMSPSPEQIRKSNFLSKNIKAVAGRLNKWKDGQESALYAEAVAVASHRTPAPPRSNISRVTYLARCGRIKDACRALTSPRLLVDGPEVGPLMDLKHPLNPLPIPPLTLGSSSISIEPKSLKEHIKSFPARSGVGPDGISSDLLKSMLQYSSADVAAGLLEALADFFHHLLANGDEYSVEFRQLFAGARLTALEKPPSS